MLIEMYEDLVYKGSIAKQVSFLPSVPLTIYHPAKEFLNPAIRENILCVCVCMCVCVWVCVTCRLYLSVLFHVSINIAVKTWAMKQKGCVRKIVYYLVQEDQKHWHGIFPQDKPF